jgi:prophage DNA circulation protein
VDHLEEAIGWIKSEHHDVDAELEGFWSSATQVQNMVLGGPTGTSSLVASLSSAVELIKGRINIVAANLVRWGTGSVLATTLCHFLQLETELELLGCRHKADLMKDQVDALWTKTHRALESLVSCIISMIAHGVDGHR